MFVVTWGQAEFYVSACWCDDWFYVRMFRTGRIRSIPGVSTLPPPVGQGGIYILIKIQIRKHEQNC